MSDIERLNMTEIENDKPNRNYKDSIFVDLLTYKEENLRQVCKALGESTQDEAIELLQVKNTAYTGLKHDVSCLIGRRLLMLIEHQSTINQNMPMRCLQYLGRLYEGIIPKRNRYLIKPDIYPNPECYTFYNGDAPYPPYQKLYLSKMFVDQNKPLSVELVVEVFNINYSENNELLQRCPILNEYALFVDQVKRNRKDGREGYDRAVHWALKNGILEEYLSMKTRVIDNMLIAEYDPEFHMQVRLEEAREEAREDGREEGKIEMAYLMKSRGYSMAEISDISGLSKEVIESL